jgi:hypothetical protein
MAMNGPQQNAYDATPLASELTPRQFADCRYFVSHSDGTRCVLPHEPFLPEGFKTLPAYSDIRSATFKVAENRGNAAREAILRDRYQELSGSAIPWLWGPTGEGLKDDSAIVEAP